MASLQRPHRVQRFLDPLDGMNRQALDRLFRRIGLITDRQFNRMTPSVRP